MLDEIDLSEYTKEELYEMYLSERQKFENFVKQRIYELNNEIARLKTEIAQSDILK